MMRRRTVLVLLVMLAVVAQPVSGSMVSGSMRADSDHSLGTLDEGDPINATEDDCLDPTAWEVNNTTYFLCLNKIYQTDNTIKGDFGAWEKGESGLVYFHQTPGKFYGHVGYWDRYSGNSTLVALDPITEHVVWNYTLDSVYDGAGGMYQPWTSMAVEDGTLYLITPRAKALALNASTGEIVWQQKIADKLVSDGWKGKVRIRNNTLIAKITKKNGASVSKLALFDVESGERLYSKAGRSRVLDLGPDILIHTVDSTVRYDTTSKKTVWKSPGVFSVIDASWVTPQEWWSYRKGLRPVELDGFNVYQGPNQFIFLDTQTGDITEQPIGEQRLTLQPWSTATGEYVLVTGVRGDELTRKHEFEVFSSGGGSAPSVDVQEYVYRIYSADGTLEWEKRIQDEDFETAPGRKLGLEGEVLYLYHPREQMLRAYDTKTGHKEWKIDVSNELQSGGWQTVKVLDNGTVIVQRHIDPNTWRQVMIDADSQDIFNVRTAKTPGTSVHLNRMRTSNHSITLNNSGEPDSPAVIEIRDTSDDLVTKTHLTGTKVDYHFVQAGKWGILQYDPNKPKAALYDVDVRKNTPPSISIQGEPTIGADSQLRIHISDDGHGGPHMVNWSLLTPSGERVNRSGQIIDVSFEKTGKARINLTVRDKYGASTHQRLTFHVAENSRTTTTRSTGATSTQETTKATVKTTTTATVKTKTTTPGMDILTAVGAILALIVGILRQGN